VDTHVQGGSLTSYTKNLLGSENMVCETYFLVAGKEGKLPSPQGRGFRAIHFRHFAPYGSAKALATQAEGAIG
jgi:hypothetical protein